jgi:hypothetical protein
MFDTLSAVVGEIGGRPLKPRGVGNLFARPGRKKKGQARMSFRQKINKKRSLQKMEAIKYGMISKVVKVSGRW